MTDHNPCNSHRANLLRDIERQLSGHAPREEFTISHGSFEWWVDNVVNNFGLAGNFVQSGMMAVIVEYNLSSFSFE